jgi:hypothetical protein
MFGRNDFLGEVTLPLKMTDLANPMPKWYKLQEKVSCSSALRNKNQIYTTILTLLRC